MADDRLDLVLRSLETPILPDPAFADRLFAQVAPMAIAAGRQDSTWWGRFLGVLHGRVPWTTMPRANHGRLLGAVLLAAALIALIAALIGASRSDPARLVQLSESVYLDPPPFDMTVTYQNGDVRRFRFDGESHMRLDVIAGAYNAFGPGSYAVTDTHRRAYWDSSTEIGVVQNVVGPNARPVELLDMRWGGINTMRTSSLCNRWSDAGITTIADRSVRHVRCAASGDEEAWIDPVSGFILRFNAAIEQEPEGVRTMTAEARRFDLEPATDAATFVIPDSGGRWGVAMPGGNAAMADGERAVTMWFTPAFAVVPQAGWRSWGEGEDSVGFVRGEPLPNNSNSGLWGVRLSVVWDAATGRDRTLDPGAQAAIDWIRADPYLRVGRETSTTVDGHSATRLDLRIVPPPADDPDCPWDGKTIPEPPCRRWFWTAPGYWTYGPELQAVTVTILDVGKSVLMIITQAVGPDAANHQAAIDELLATLDFLD